MDEAKQLQLISTRLSPERPIRSTEFLRGRGGDLTRVERELRHFHAVPFIYGYRGVGKTSLALAATPNSPTVAGVKIPQ
jgi:uncharacterized protein